MGKFIKIVLGLGVVAGISYYGRNRQSAEQLANRGAGVLGYLKGLGQGLYLGIKHSFRFLEA